MIRNEARATVKGGHFMKRTIFIMFFVGATLLALTGLFNRGFAEVNVNVGIGLPPPPPLVIPAPPPMFVIPRTYVYFAPDVDVDIFFYQGYWYRPHQGHWYRSKSYNGKWVYISPNRVPRSVINVPHDFRRVPPGYRHVPYGDVRKHWKTWERDKYWDRHGGREWHGEGRREPDRHDHDKGGSRGRHGD
jgi:hypothetical protein